MPSNNRRFRLRERTSRAHASLDQLIGKFCSRADYERYILGIYAFRVPLEEKLTATDWPEAFGRWRPQLIGAALRADVFDLGLLPSVDSDRSALTLDLETFLGTLYVLEGSALGAKILYRRAQDIGLNKIFGARHLALQSDGPDNWREFLAVLEQPSPIAFETVVAASNAVFHAAEQAFAGHQNADRQPT